MIKKKTVILKLIYQDAKKKLSEGSSLISIAKKIAKEMATSCFTHIKLLLFCRYIIYIHNYINILHFIY